MPPPNVFELGSAENMPGPAGASVSAAHVVAAAAWSATAAAASMLGSAAPTSTPGSGSALMATGPSAELEDDRGGSDGGVVVPELDELDTLKRSRSSAPEAR